MERIELKAWLRLSLTPGVGNDTARKLLAAFGSAEAVFEQNEAALRQLSSDRLVSAITTEPPKLADLLQVTTDWLAGGDDRAVAPIGSALYPAALLNIEDPPLMLYVMGAQLKKAPTAIKNVALNLAIVGSRNPTPQGEQNARQFAKAFAEQGLCIVSGLALGVDGAAHDGALLGGGQTIAVVGTGLDRVYPKKHLALAHRIAANGLIISEFPIGTPPINANFPKRNRIISGLSVGTLVVEAALKSGSLITARLASEQGKDVFAIPGSIHSPQSRGCHYLIKQGAKLVETAQDVMEELRIPYSQVAPLLGDDDDEAPEGDSSFLSALGFDIVSLDALQARTGLPTPELQAKLLGLELDGFVRRLPGGLFQRMSAG
ncbi:MAG: DNA-protecting protein DprA [Vitreoscilla sp.]|nr:DNA-protecting protein DprA [Polaromonas sp.]